MKPNRMKQVLAEGKVPVGHMVAEFTTRGIAKILESTGVDFVLIDMEHTSAGAERIGDLIAWLKATPITPIVRVPQPNYHFIARTLDAGSGVFEIDPNRNHLSCPGPRAPSPQARNIGPCASSVPRRSSSSPRYRRSCARRCV